MEHPDVLSDLHGVDHRKALARNYRAISNTPDLIPCIGFAMSALPPSATIVSANRKTDLASSGRVSNSPSAALIHETGRVRGVIATPRLPGNNVVRYDNGCQAAGKPLSLASHRTPHDTPPSPSMVQPFYDHSPTPRRLACRNSRLRRFRPST